jgi:hypothetical protein
MRILPAALALAAAVGAAACGDERSVTSAPVGDLGFGINLARTATNLPRGTVTFPATVTATGAAAATDSVVLLLAGLDSLTSGSYVVWAANDSATKFAKLEAFNVTATRIDSTVNALGDPVFTPTITVRTGQTALRSGGPNVTFRIAAPRSAFAALGAADSLNTVLVSQEANTGVTTPGEVRFLWARRSQAATNRVASVRFGAFARGIPAAGRAGSPAANQEFVVATNGAMTIVPRGRVEVRGKILVVNDSNYLRPPVGYYYNAYAVKYDTTGRFVDTVYLGRRTSPYPERISLFDADKSNPAPTAVFDSPRVIFAMATRVSTDTIADANSTPPWLNFGEVRINLQSKFSAEGRMGPSTVMQAILPKSVRGR